MTHEKIIKLVCQEMGVTEEQVKGKLRTRTIALARQMAAYLLWKHTNFSLTEIGQIMGGRDHSTVIHSRDNILGCIEINQYPAAEVIKLEIIIRNQLSEKVALTEMSEIDLISHALDSLKKNEFSFVKACLNELLCRQKDALVAMHVDQKMFEEVNG